MVGNKYLTECSVWGEQERTWERDNERVEHSPVHGVVLGVAVVRAWSGDSNTGEESC